VLLILEIEIDGLSWSSQHV